MRAVGPSSGFAATEVVVSTERRFLQTPQGIFARGSENRHFFERYLRVFERVHVLARVENSPDPHPPGYLAADGPGIVFHALPPFKGLAGALTTTVPLVGNVRELAAVHQGPWILRVPGAVASIAWAGLIGTRTTVGLEVVTDPAEEYDRAAMGSLAGAVLGRIAESLLRLQCARAAGAAYVTEQELQRKYPPGSTLTTNYSSIDLEAAVVARADVIERRLRQQPERLESPSLIFVGNLDRPLKGLDILLQALALLPEDRLHPRLTVVGDGVLRGSYEEDVRTLGLGGVRFLGSLPPGDPVYDELARADLFVLPSRREGLPRVVVEAMAVGLPAICTNVSGAGELLDSGDIVPREDPASLAAKIQEFAGSRGRRLAASRRNNARARSFERKVLQPRRDAYYRALAEMAVTGRS